jgi:hypothetical protein
MRKELLKKVVEEHAPEHELEHFLLGYTEEEAMALIEGILVEGTRVFWELATQHKELMAEMFDNKVVGVIIKALQVCNMQAVLNALGALWTLVAVAEQRKRFLALGGIKALVKVLHTDFDPCKPPFTPANICEFVKGDFDRVEDSRKQARRMALASLAVCMCDIHCRRRLLQDDHNLKTLLHYTTIYDDEGDLEGAVQLPPLDQMAAEVCESTPDVCESTPCVCESTPYVCESNPSVYESTRSCVRCCAATWSAASTLRRGGGSRSCATCWSMGPTWRPDIWPARC